MIDIEVAELLLSEAERINTPAFIADDPVQFPRRFSDMRDIEIAALLTSVISWGKRQMILRDAGRMLSMMENQPFLFVAERGYEAMDGTVNVHRTFFVEHMQWLLRALYEIYQRHGTLEAFAKATGASGSMSPAWALAEGINKVAASVNEGRYCPRCLPSNLATSALKRLNMALRWLVRDDGIVDIGIWDSIPKSRLFIPLDVHVGNTARRLGLLERKANDRKSVEILTSAMREIDPEDPARLDFALFGIGIEGRFGNRETGTGK